MFSTGYWSRFRGWDSVGLVLGLTGGLAAPGGAPRPAGSITWKACADVPGAECGQVAVPVDWSKPKGGTLQLAVARFRAQDPAKRIGTLLLPEGTPGGYGLWMLKALESDTKRVLSQRLRAHFDIVTYAARGSEHSNPIECDPKLNESANNRPAPGTRLETGGQGVGWELCAP